MCFVKKKTLILVNLEVSRQASSPRKDEKLTRDFAIRLRASDDDSRATRRPDPAPAPGTRPKEGGWPDHGNPWTRRASSA